MQNQSGTSATPPSDTVVRSKGPNRTGLYAAIAVVVVVIIIVGAGYGLGWFKSSSSSVGTCTAGVTLNGAGSTLVAPLMFTWASEYTVSTVNYASVGSGAGISQITAKTVDYGASDAPLSPAQRSALSAPVATIPESAGAVVPIYNLPGLSTTLKFSGAVLAAIYLGDITNWNNTPLQTINPGVTLPNVAISVVHRSDGSGTTFIWTSFLSAANATWKSTVGFATAVNWPVGIGSKGNSGVTATVKSTADAIGYVDINYALTQSVSYGSVQNPSDNFILANVSNVASAIQDANPTFPSATGDWYNVSVLNAPGAHDYPIASFTYVFVYADLGTAYGSAFTQGEAENLVNFLTWIVTTGQLVLGRALLHPVVFDRRDVG